MIFFNSDFFNLPSTKIGILETLMRDLGTRLECQQRVFVRTGKTLSK